MTIHISDLMAGYQDDTVSLSDPGITTPELQEVLFSEDAPVSHGQVTLKEGRHGPVVKKLQEALKQLGGYLTFFREE